MCRDDQAVEVIEVDASRVLDIEPLVIMARHCASSVVGEGKALLLIGQWLLEQRSFPSRAFRLHRWAHTRRLIPIESIGAEIIPEHSTVQLPSDSKIGDVELFGRTPRDVTGGI